MNKNHILTIASILLFLLVSISTSAAIIVPVPTETSSPAKTENARMNELIQRLNVIKSMDKSDLSRTERKSLRHELQQTKKEMKAMSGGVYLSVGAIIIVILLLILIL